MEITGAYDKFKRPRLCKGTLQRLSVSGQSPIEWIVQLKGRGEIAGYMAHKTLVRLSLPCVLVESLIHFSL